jgi:hypothetical protein
LFLTVVDGEGVKHIWYDLIDVGYVFEIGVTGRCGGICFWSGIVDVGVTEN